MRRIAPGPSLGVIAFGYNRQAEGGGLDGFIGMHGVCTQSRLLGEKRYAKGERQIVWEPPLPLGSKVGTEEGDGGHLIDLFGVRCNVCSKRFYESCYGCF